MVIVDQLIAFNVDSKAPFRTGNKLWLRNNPYIVSMVIAKALLNQILCFSVSNYLKSSMRLLRLFQRVT